MLIKLLIILLPCSYYFKKLLVSPILYMLLGGELV